MEKKEKNLKRKKKGKQTVRKQNAKKQNIKKNNTRKYNTMESDIFQNDVKKNNGIKNSVGENAVEKNNIREEIGKTEFRITCQYAINLVELKLKMLQEEMTEEYDRNPISVICSRIKSSDSICRKLKKKGHALTFENARTKLNDLVGVRATCFFEDDIYELVKRLSKQNDVTVIKEKDYIGVPKDNGYKSFHLIIQVPTFNGIEGSYCKVEIQFRTVAMDFWAQLDYQLCYKKNLEKNKHKKVEEKLAAYAQEIEKLDRGMLKLRKEIERL